MHNFLKKIIALDRHDINYGTIEAILKTDDIDLSLYNTSVCSDTKEYKRIPILCDYVQIYAMVWPIGGKSSVHQHQNFGGLLKVITGELEEQEFIFNENENRLFLQKRIAYKKNSIIKEEPNATHQIFNITQENVISLHVYFPSVADFSGCRIFNLEEKKSAILSDKATNFSWNQPEEAFQKIENFNF